MARDDCAHECWAVRMRLAAHGEIFAKQCLSCGGLVGTWLKRDAALALSRGAPAPWDESLARAWLDRRAAAEEAARAAERKAWWTRYRAYMRGPEWARVRAKVFARAKNACEGCGEAKAHAVHHMTYEHLGAEFLWELVALCEACHARVHGWRAKGEGEGR